MPVFGEKKETEAEGIPSILILLKKDLEFLALGLANYTGQAEVFAQLVTVLKLCLLP